MWQSNKNKVAGWTAVDFASEGVFGVSVGMPTTARGKPRVVKFGMVPEAQVQAAALSKLARMISVPDYSWTLPLQFEDYKLLVLPEPAVKPAEMADSLRWSLATMVDFPVVECTLDWMPIPTKKYLPERKTHIYAIVVKNELLTQNTEPFRAAKIGLRAVDIRETSQRNIAALFEKPGETLGMVSVGSERVVITFTLDGELFLDRNIAVSLDSVIHGDDEQRGKLLDHVTLQVQRSIDFLRRTMPFMKIGRIMVAPLPAPIALREHLAAHVKEPVVTADLASVFDFSRTPQLADEEFQARYFVALGAALRGQEARA